MRNEAFTLGQLSTPITACSWYGPSRTKYKQQCSPQHSPWGGSKRLTPHLCLFYKGTQLAKSVWRAAKLQKYIAISAAAHDHGDEGGLQTRHDAG